MVLSSVALGRDGDSVCVDLSGARTLLSACSIEIEGVVGRGSFGVVFRAYCGLRRGRVAVKLVRDDVTSLELSDLVSEASRSFDCACHFLCYCSLA